MAQYPKRILSIEEQVQSYIDAGMQVPSRDEAVDALKSIGYYRLRGYCYHLYDNATKRYQVGTSFSDVMKLYQFDRGLSQLLFSLSAAIEVSLRAHLSDALLSVYQDPLVLYDPVAFKDKSNFWKNMSTLSREIARASDVFIQHNFDTYDGMIPIWAAVEIMSLGNLSMIVKNLKSGQGSAAQKLLSQYRFVSKKGNHVTPSLPMFSSWTHTVTVLRNICAHNGRIYNRVISTKAQIPEIDAGSPVGRYNGVYQIILAMKYLRPSDAIWKDFVTELTALLQKYNGVVELGRINFPPDWANHLRI